MAKEIRHIAFLVIPQVTLLDVAGPCEVFTQVAELIKSNEIIAGLEYKMHYLSADKVRNVPTASGIIIHCTESIKSVDYDIDTLFIPGLPNHIIGNYQLTQSVLNWIKKQSQKVRRICSICTGSFILAEAGVLAGKSATTHWEKCEIFARMFPDVKLEADPIFIKDDNVYTSAGISSGMDLALALVEEDLGREIALAVAKQMVLYLKRPGNQSQYSVVLTHQNTDHRPIQVICSWIRENLSNTITVENLAERISMSPRNFARVFVRETGNTPAKYIEKLRVESACRFLVDTRLSLKEIALNCGLGSQDNMRKIFIRHIQISPTDYRKNFGTASSPSG